LNQVKGELPRNRGLAQALDATVARTWRMKDENRALALQHCAGTFVAQMLALDGDTSATVATMLGRRPELRRGIVELLAQYPFNPVFLQGLREQLPQAFPELQGRGGRGPSDTQRLAALNAFSNQFALTRDAMPRSVYAQMQHLIETHPRDQDYLRGLRDVVRSFPRHQALTGSLTTEDALAALHRYDVGFTEAKRLQDDLRQQGVTRKVSNPAPAPDQKPFSKGARDKLVAAFSMEGMGFFELYGTMQDVARGQPPPADLTARIDAAVAALNQLVAPDKKRISPDVLNDVRRGAEELKAIASRLSGNAPLESPQPLERFRVKYQLLALQLAHEKGVDLTQTEKEKGSWADFRLMTERQSASAALAAADPQMAALLEQRKLTYRELDEQIHGQVIADGRRPQNAFILQRSVTLGVNPDDPDDKVVYDLDGKQYSIEEFKDRRLVFMRSMKRLAKVGDETDVPLSSLRSVTDDDRLAALDGPTETVALTDDKAKIHGMTRLLETRWDDDQRVVVSGRFKGVYLDDLINANGRLIEGTAFTFDPKSGASHGLPVKRNPHDREPYVTLDKVKERGVIKEKLVVRLPRFQGEWTEVRRRMRALTEGRGAVPTIQYKQGSKNTKFIFEAKDFAAVKDAVGGMSLSSAALKHVQGYFDTLTVADRAVTEQNIENFSEKFIPGLKPGTKLITPQKEGMAWLEANGNNGVIALDTGIGKTLLAICQMQKLLRDGYDQERGSNGRFVYVCPKPLKGNIIAEIYTWLEPKAAKELIARLDVVSYEELAKANKDLLDPQVKVAMLNGHPYRPKRYVGAFFDEPQVVNRDTGSQRSRAALAFDNPHKVCLTASPMQESPLEAYVLSCVASNIDLRDPGQRKVYLSEMQRFKERYCETIGGRIVGVKRDPLVRRELATWVKQRIFFRDKREVPELRLPQLHRHPPQTVEMGEEHAQLYRDHLGKFNPAMRALVSIYRDKGLLVDAKDEQGNPVVKRNPAARHPELKKRNAQEVKALLKQLRRVAAAPELLMPDEVKEASPDDEDQTNWNIKETYLKMGMPSIDAAVERFTAKLERSPDSRAVMFAEDEGMVLAAAKRMSNEVPGKVHAACLRDRIVLFRSGQTVDWYNGHKAPFTAKEYLKNPDAPADDDENRTYAKAEWQQFVLNELLLEDTTGVQTLCMLGRTYQQGFNLQKFDTVCHLDLVMNAQDVQQREARVWRQGNLNSDVDVFTFVPTFAEPVDPLSPTVAERKDSLDRTVAELDQAYVEVFEEVFNEMIKESQHTELGGEWFTDIEHRQASTLKVGLNPLGVLISPYPSRVAQAA
jgi:hypothetical protein